MIHVDLHALLTYLDTRPQREEWREWRIQPISGGRNNLLYRATGAAGDLAIKFCRADERDRAGREYDALCVLDTHGLEVAPKPILLDRERHSYPVVVQSWLEGNVSAAPPTTDDQWRHFISHYAIIRRITPDNCSIPLRRAVTNMDSFAAGQDMIAAQTALLPDTMIDGDLRDLLRQIRRLPDPGAPAVRHTLCRVDANAANFVRRPGVWASVDWENSGWGDPAFEIVDMMTHAAFLAVPRERWEWVITEYTRLTGDENAPTRIRQYYPLMLVWWVVRLARYLYEIPRGLDDRLVDHAPDWEQDIRRKYGHYLALATAELAET